MSKSTDNDSKNSLANLKITFFHWFSGCFSARFPHDTSGVFSGDCKYKFGQWSPCDAATNTKTRSGVLKRVLFNAECQTTVKVSKPCSPKVKKTRGKAAELQRSFRPSVQKSELLWNQHWNNFKSGGSDILLKNILSFL